MVRNAKVIDYPIATDTATASVATGGEVAIAGAPVHLYRGSDGSLYASNAIVDGSSKTGKWGISQEAVASTVSSDFIISGKATVAGGGTAGQIVTAISASGGITCASPASANTDLGLGVCIDATNIIIY